MARGRKTIDVAEVHKMISNMMWSPAAQRSEEVRATLCMVMEQVLMDTGNYRGFQFIDAEGKRTVEGTDVIDATTRPIIVGENYYRRAYYLPSELIRREA